VLISKHNIKIELAKYCHQLSNESLALSTRCCYSSRAAQFVRFLLTTAADPVDIQLESQHYYEVLKEELYAPSSINASFTAVENFLFHLTNRSFRFARLECNKTEVQTLSDLDQIRLLSCIDAQLANAQLADPHEADNSAKSCLLILLLLQTGMSIRSLVALNIEDLTAGSIKLPSSLVNHRAVARWLGERLAIAPAEEVALFPNEKGQRITPAGASHLVKRFGWRAKLELSGRILRNTYLANLANSKRVSTEAEGERICANAERLTVLSAREAMGKAGATPSTVPASPALKSADSIDEKMA